MFIGAGHYMENKTDKVPGLLGPQFWWRFQILMCTMKKIMQPDGIAIAGGEATSKVWAGKAFL